MGSSIKADGKYILLTEYIKSFECAVCGRKDVNLKYMPTNNAIQIHCGGCGKFIGNLKYDYSKEEHRYHLK